MEGQMQRKGIIDWEICFICQKEKKKERTRSTITGLNTLAEMLQKFIDINYIDTNINRLLCENENMDITTILLSNNAQYHHSCSLKNNMKMFERQCTKQDKEPQAGCSRRNSESNVMGELRCCFCSHIDTSENLIAAGTMHVSQDKASGMHVDDLTEKWKRMAALNNNQDLLRKLSFGDVTSNELFYHRDCYQDFRNIYRREEKKQMELDCSTLENVEKWTKAISLSKIVGYIYETERDAHGNIFNAKSLETLYIDLLKCHGIQAASHVTRFAEKLLLQIEDLEKKTVGRTTSLYFKHTFNSIMRDSVVEPDNFMKSLRSVIRPIRDAMCITKNKFEGYFLNDSQTNSVPIQLLSFISMLVDGTYITNKGFSQAALTCSQIIMYNFRKCPVRKAETKRRHLKERETPVVIYNSLKLYATVKSKVLLDHFFNLGICLSYERVLDITKGLYDSMKTKFEKDSTTCTKERNIYGDGEG